MKRRTLSPRQCRTFDQVCSLNTDNHSSPDGWIIIDSGSQVTIANQRHGHPAESMTTLPRAQFDRLIDWYNRPQTIPAKRNKGRTP